jgi:hypothetical protein
VAGGHELGYDHSADGASGASNENTHASLSCETFAEGLGDRLVELGK